MNGLKFKFMPAGIKSLHEVLAEYVVLKEQETFRSRFLANNTLARSLQATLDRHAGLRVGPAVPHAAPAAAVHEQGAATELTAPQEGPEPPAPGHARLRKRAPARKSKRRLSDVANATLADLDGVLGPEVSLGELLRNEALQVEVGTRVAARLNETPGVPAAPAPARPSPPNCQPLSLLTGHDHARHAVEATTPADLDGRDGPSFTPGFGKAQVMVMYCTTAQGRRSLNGDRFFFKRDSHFLILTSMPLKPLSS